MRDDELAYEVVWDGTHQGRDADLLVAPRLPAKREAPPLRINGYVDGTRRVAAERPLPQQRRTLNAILLALHHATAPLSALEVSFLAHVSEYTARRVLAKLEAKGQVGWSRRPGEYRWVGVYTLAARSAGKGAAA